MTRSKAVHGRASVDSGEPLPNPDSRGTLRSTPPGEAGFDVVVVILDSQVVAAVRGEVDMETAPLLWTHLEEALPAAKDRLVVDLRDTTFIDSTGVAVFIRAFKWLQDAGAELVLRCPSPTARKVFAVTGLDTVITIEG